ncbi:hypothetical protein M0657_009725 [Pyricularia oryzae]|uniref:uncharacterized protein n=1 Tax=Pyricularia pennisetigena TaxID=1578925 RepID=UPI00114F7050|nr:uncharacterized protein PpBr36_10337 [Pyricularia pennisetigena]KAI7914000.1 hypothetical protein M0657_009725 [Pyricularia oryzae]TLS21465.1 hypothetical protein PpBr36_10337 [Pyricularia pennisetigena]
MTASPSSFASRSSVRSYFGKHTPQQGGQYSVRLFYLEARKTDFKDGLHQQPLYQLNHLPIPTYAVWNIDRFLARVARLCCFSQTMNNTGPETKEGW